MHHIPQFFTRSDKRKNMDSKQKLRGPKLERRLAKKNIDYEPTSFSFSSSSSSAASDESVALRTRSLDLSPFGDRTSFRVQGIDGEFDRICRSLGLSGPDDFAIPADAWEARKVRSSSDQLPRSRLKQLESPKADTVLDCIDVSGNDGGDVCELSDRFKDSVSVSGDRDNYKCTISADTSRGGGGGGIKGVRPPVLAPPPSILRPVIDNECSTWDILRSFGPDSDRGLCSGRQFSYYDDDEEEEEEEEDIMNQKGLNGVSLGEIAVLSGSCSFTTSNDDDSSSTTTEPRSNSISPNGKIKRIITTDWQKGELLGRGSFGSVYEGIADCGFFFAVKEVSLLDQGEQGRQSILQLEQEIDLLSQFKHENIVLYYGTQKDESNLYIFLELVAKGSLLSLYQKYKLRDSQVSSYTRQILHGLKYLHERNVVHRDIKCANILVDADGNVKLADFGLAKATKLNDVKSCKGTAFWMAPEVVKRNNEGYGLPADIWSLGCTVLEMLTGQFPYSHLECMQALFRIGKGEPPPVPDSLSADARDFILKCLQVNPNARPTATQLLDHPFVKRPIPTLLGSSSPYNSGPKV